MKSRVECDQENHIDVLATSRQRSQRLMADHGFDPTFP